MRPETTMPEETANAIYTLLAKHAGAPEHSRADFVYHQTNGEVCTEYRFFGSLGAGGKFWRNPSLGRCPWYVNGYPEQMTDARREAIRVTNEALAALYADANCPV